MASVVYHREERAPLSVTKKNISKDATIGIEGNVKFLREM